MNPSETLNKFVSAASSLWLLATSQNNVSALTTISEAFHVTLADTLLSLLTLDSARSNLSATRPPHLLSTLSAGEHPS